jgi:hypothetical protein
MPAIDTAHHNLLMAHTLHAARCPGAHGQDQLPRTWSALITGTRVVVGLDAFDGGKAWIPFDVLLRLIEIADEGFTAFWTCP